MKYHRRLFCLSLVLTALFMSCTVGHAQTVLRYTDHEPYGNMRTRAINEIFFHAVERESQRKVKIEAHWGGELSTSYDALSTIAEGKKADMGIVVPEYSPAQLPLHQIFKSFPVGPDTGAAQVAFFKHLFLQNPQFSRELNDNKLINLQFFLGYPAGFSALHRRYGSMHWRGPAGARPAFGTRRGSGTRGERQSQCRGTTTLAGR